MVLLKMVNGPLKVCTVFESRAIATLCYHSRPGILADSEVEIYDGVALPVLQVVKELDPKLAYGHAPRVLLVWDTLSELTRIVAMRDSETWVELAESPEKPDAVDMLKLLAAAASLLRPNPG